MNQASSPATQLKPQQQETISGMAKEEEVGCKFRSKNIPIGSNCWTLSDFKAPDKLA
jgi:hypothetical protein